MGVSEYITESIKKASWIRKMFEVGLELKAKHGEENVFDLSLGNPIIEPPEDFVEVLKDVVNNPQPGMHRYMPNAGMPYVRESVAQKLSSERCKEFKKEDIIMTVGAAGGLNVVLESLLNPGEEVIVMAPYFSEYTFYIEMHGGKVVISETTEDFDLDIENIAQKITQKTKAVLINSPNNPTGKMYSDETLKKLGDLLKVKEHELGTTIFLVSDEPYRGIVYNGVTPPDVFKHYDRTILAFSYSKELALPGQRIGFLAVSPDCTDKQSLLNCLTFCNRVLGFVNAPAIMQMAIAKSHHLKVDSEIYKKKRDLMVDALSDFGYTLHKPEGAFYLFPKSPTEDDIEFVQALQQELVLVVPGSGFFRKGHFRIAYCVPDKVLENSLDGFKKLAEKYNLK